jgi:hypothetical protein
MRLKVVLGIMLTLLFLSMFMSTFQAVLAQPPSTEWAKTYGSGTAELATSVVQTSDGGYAIAGLTYSHLSNEDFWLVKTDTMGVMEWNQTYGGSSPEYAFSLVQTSDGGFVIAGSTMSFGSGADDFWVVKTDSVGTMEWNKTYGGPTLDPGYSMIQTSDCGYAIAGGTYSFGAGASDFLLVKLAPEVTWEYIFEDQYRDTVIKISTDDKLFQFIAPNKEFQPKHDPNMHLWKFRSSMIISINYKDADVRLIVNIVDSSFDFCFANVRDSQSGERYLLIDRLYSRCMHSCGSRSTVMK